MEASSAASTPAVSTGSKTIADLIGRAAQRYGDATAIRSKRDGDWHDVSFAELGEIVSEVGRGLIDVGIEPGERVCILCNTRPEWTYADFGISSAGAVVVPIYPTNSPEECEWVAGNSEAVAVICEDAAQATKILAVRERLPALRAIVVVDPIGDVGDAISLDDLRARGRQRERDELIARAEAVTPEDPFTFIYTSGTTGPPKGCVLSHRNYRSVLDMVEDDEIAILAPGDSVYLFLPLAHAFALLVQLAALDVGVTIAYWTGDANQIVAELGETQPTYFPSVPRIFEKIYTLAVASQPPERQDEMRRAAAVGAKVRDLQARGEPVPSELKEPFDAAEEALFGNVRAIFGGRLRQAVTGAAPIATDILEFFYGCGIPVLEGYGMTETATVATYSTIEDHRFGTVGRALPGCEIRIAGDGEVLVRGANIFEGYYRNDDASFGSIVDGWLHTGDLGSLDADGYLSVTGRKKDIIITAGGKNLTPANIENDLKASRWISQAVMHGDRRPFPVALIALDPDEIVKWAVEHDKPQDVAALSRDPDVRALVQEVLDAANAKYAQVEQVKRFFILDHDLSQETGELTPTLKVKRNVVNEKYATDFDALYAGGA